MTDRRHFRDPKITSIDTGTAYADSLTMLRRSMRRQTSTKGKIHVQATYQPYETGAYTRLTKTKEFWRIEALAGSILVETTRPEFDMATELAKRGHAPETTVSFMRGGQTVLTADLRTLRKGYHVTTNRGLEFVTRQKHEENERRTTRLRQQNAQSVPRIAGKLPDSGQR